jgi:hypothetical protein
MGGLMKLVGLMVLWAMVVFLLGAFIAGTFDVTLWDERGKIIGSLIWFVVWGFHLSVVLDRGIF